MAKLIMISKGYGEIIQDSPVDLTPEILKWKKRRRSNLTDQKLNFHSSILSNDETKNKQK